MFVKSQLCHLLYPDLRYLIYFLSSPVHMLRRKTWIVRRSMFFIADLKCPCVLATAYFRATVFKPIDVAFCASLMCAAYIHHRDRLYKQLVTVEALHGRTRESWSSLWETCLSVKRKLLKKLLHNATENLSREPSTPDIPFHGTSDAAQCGYKRHHWPCTQ